MAGDLYRGAAGEGGLAGGRLVERRPERVDVALGRHLLPLELLGGGVERGPKVGPCKGGLGGVQGAGYAEVRHLGVAVLVEEDVVGLYVAVDHAPLVRVGQPGADLHAEPGELRAGQPPSAVYELFEVPAGDVLHHYVGAAVAVERPLARVVDLDDVGVGQPGGGAALALEAPADVRAAVHGVEHLYGHGPVENLVAPEEHPGHASRAELALQHEPVSQLSHAGDYRVRRLRCRTIPPRRF